MIEQALKIIDGKFKCIILSYLFDGPTRFNELHRQIGSVTIRTLANQLRELEADGLVSRVELPVTPRGVEYSLTVRGRELEPLMYLLRDWAETNLAPWAKPDR